MALACSEALAARDGKPPEAHSTQGNGERPPLDSHWRALLSKLAQDPNSCVRSAALTPDRAAALMADPELETSWQVLERAAWMARTPIWNISSVDAEPQRSPAANRANMAVASRTSTTSTPITSNTSSTPDIPPAARVPLGAIQDVRGRAIEVSRIGISGHYGLPPRGFGEAIDAGVNLFFWEPGYTTMSQFWCEASCSSKADWHTLAGTFKATADGVRKDVHRALRLMKLERLTLFLLFWTRGWGRLTEELLDELERLIQCGDIAHFSLSTHDRQLASEAMIGGGPAHGLTGARSWNPIMVRYSAAHRGAESQLFPTARQTGTTVDCVQQHLLWPIAQTQTQ